MSRFDLIPRKLLLPAFGDDQNYAQGISLSYSPPGC